MLNFVATQNPSGYPTNMVALNLSINDIKAKIEKGIHPIWWL